MIFWDRPSKFDPFLWNCKSSHLVIPPSYLPIVPLKISWTLALFSIAVSPFLCGTYVHFPSYPNLSNNNREETRWRWTRIPITVCHRGRRKKCHGMEIVVLPVPVLLRETCIVHFGIVRHSEIPSGRLQRNVSTIEWPLRVHFYVSCMFYLHWFKKGATIVDAMLK